MLSSSLSLLNNFALITGGSRGLGFSISRKLASEGCNVILCARNKERLQQAKTTLPMVHSLQKHYTLQCDLSSPSQIGSIFGIFPKTLSSQTQNNPLSVLNNDVVVPPLDRVNILINCAGIMQQSLLVRTPTDQVSSIIDTNLTGPILLSRAFARSMMKPGLKKISRCIINVSSILGLPEGFFKNKNIDSFSSSNSSSFKAHALQSAPPEIIIGSLVYAASKSGLIGFSQSFALEMKPAGIEVHCVTPGLIKETEMGSKLIGDNNTFDSKQWKDSLHVCSIDDVTNNIYQLIVR